MIASTNSFPCPQCGGVAAPVAGREYLQCGYCRSLVFSHSNPLTVDRISPREGDIDAECPNCSKVLSTGQIEDRPVLYCTGCYGFLLKNEHFGAIVRSRRARRAGCEAESVKPLDPQQYERQILCPSCHAQMEVHPYYGPGNVVIDSCQSCEYIWLDHGELRTVERSEGGREPDLLPLYINEDGEVTIIPPPPTTAAAAVSDHNTPWLTLADVITGLW